MGFVFKRVQTKAQKNAVELDGAKAKLKELWNNKLTGSKSEIAEIIAGTYDPSGSDGAGELNGVPTAADIAAIIDGTYSHRDVETDEYALDDVPSAEDIAAIINGTYSTAVE